MRDDLSHLPQKQQDELERAKRILMEEFANAIALGNQAWKRGGRILKIILFGSYGAATGSTTPKAATSPISTCSSSLAMRS